MLSGDLGVAAKALDSEINLAFKRIPDEWKRGEEEDETQKEIRQLKEEIARYKKQEPDIKIFVKRKNNPEKTDKLILMHDTFIALKYDDVHNLERHLRDKYPVQQKPYSILMSNSNSLYNSGASISLEEIIG